MSSTSFILKILLASALLSIAIKAIGPALPLAATDLTAIVLVLSPTLIMGGLLAWRAVR